MNVAIDEMCIVSTCLFTNKILEVYLSVPPNELGFEATEDVLEETKRGDISLLFTVLHSQQFQWWGLVVDGLV